VSATLAAAQASYDARQPPEFFEDDFDDAMTPERALEQARDEIDRTPARFAEWLHNACFERNEPEDHDRDDIDSDAEDDPARLLWSLIHLRSAQHRGYACRRLIELFQNATEADAEARAAEILTLTNTTEIEQ
jgi:hypothetical protein